MNFPGGCALKNWYINFSAWFWAVGQKFTKWGVGHTFFFANFALFEKCRIRQKINDPPPIL